MPLVPKVSEKEINIYLSTVLVYGTNSSGLNTLSTRSNRMLKKSWLSKWLFTKVLKVASSEQPAPSHRLIFKTTYVFDEEP